MAHLPLRTLDKELLHPPTPTLQGLLETPRFWRIKGFSYLGNSPQPSVFLIKTT